MAAHPSLPDAVPAFVPDYDPLVDDHLILRGGVESDPDDDHRVPAVMIDGREIAWDEHGRMVAAFEGWQLKLEIRDRSEEN